MRYLEWEELPPFVVLENAKEGGEGE